MLPTNQPAKFIPFLYKNHVVRFHLHTDDSSVWVVGSDFCNIINRTNPSYFSQLLPEEAVYKHKAKTDSGSQSILWFKLDHLREYCDSDFNFWLDTEVLPKLSPSLGSFESKHTYIDPVLIERKDLEDLFSVVKKIAPYLYP